MSMSRTSERLLPITCVFCCFILVGGCCSTPKSQEEAGAVNVSVTLVAPWEDYITTLTPNYALEAQEALNKVMPRTSILEEKIVDTLGLSARLGLPQSSEARTKTTTVTGEQTATTEERVEKKEPGKLPEALEETTGSDRNAKDLQGIPQSERTLGRDPMLEYAAATALYQEVQLLNRYVTDAALRHGMKAYIVRMQIGVVPFRRNLGYDVYTKVGFFPKTHDGNDKQAYVIPLLVTDNLEGALVSRAENTIRQLALAISFIQSGIGGNVAFDKLREDYKNEMYTDMNSLFTLGRVTNNTLAARFGAARQGKDNYTMIPRTHNVTVVLMVPQEFAPKETDAPSNEIRVVARTTMRSATDGKILPQQARNERGYNVGEMVKSFLRQQGMVDKIEKVETKTCPDPDSYDSNNTVLCTQALLQTVWRNDVGKFNEVLRNAEWNNVVGRFSRDLWMDIVESLDKSHYAGVRFELPNSPQYSLPQNQAVLFVDDGNNMRASLVGGSGLVSNRMSATLNLKLAGGDVLLAGGINVGVNGADPVLTFPSPALWRLDTSGIKNGILKDAKLTLKQVNTGRWARSPELLVEYNAIVYKKTEDSKPASTIEGRKNHSGKGTQVR